jgi:integration host factor subunit beta
MGPSPKTPRRFKNARIKIGMTKVELIDNVLTATAMSKAESEAIVDAIFTGMSYSLLHGEKVEIRGFGTFGIRQRNARIGRNPKTGASVAVPEKRVACFKPSKELRALVDGEP